MPRRQLVPEEGEWRGEEGEGEWSKSNPKLEVEFDFWLSSPMAQCNLVATARQHLQSLRWLRLPAVRGLANELLGDLSRRGREWRETEGGGWCNNCTLRFGWRCVFVTLSGCFVVLSARAARNFVHIVTWQQARKIWTRGQHTCVCVCVRVQRCSCRAYHNVAGCALSYQPSHSRGGAARAPVQFNQHYFCLNQLQLITFLLSWQRQRRCPRACASLECRPSEASFELTPCLPVSQSSVPIIDLDFGYIHVPFQPPSLQLQVQLCLIWQIAVACLSLWLLQATC